MRNDEELVAHLSAQPKRLTRAEAAEFLGLSVRTLENWHRGGLPPKAVKHGKRGIRYLDTDLIALKQEWAASS